MNKTFGEVFKGRREKLGLSLREFSRVHGCDVGNVSKIEVGKYVPIRQSVLKDYARALDLPFGSVAYLEFMCIAAAASGRVPESVMRIKDIQSLLGCIYLSLLENEKKPWLCSLTINYHQGVSHEQ
jgi:transcriptional regulator with XRE-family HTH domain